MPILNKDTQLCISLAARPSNIGTRFHNYLYQALGLDFVYKAFAPRDLTDAVRGIRGLPIRGAAVSMPYKEAVIPLVDRMDESAAALQSVNTIVNEGGVLTAYNTDYLAVARLLREREIAPEAEVLLRGSGGMAKAVVAAFHDAGFRRLTIISRNGQTGRALAERYGLGWLHEFELEEASSHELAADVLVNVTPLGMAGAEADQLAFPESLVAAAATVFDVVAFPVQTPLIRLAHARGVPVITGAEVIALQAEEQFVLYTGVRPTPGLVREASVFSRG